MPRAHPNSSRKRQAAGAIRKRGSPRILRIGVFLSEGTGYGRGVLKGIADFAEDHPECKFHVETPDRRGIHALGAWNPDGLLVMLNCKALAPLLQNLARPIVTVCDIPALQHTYLVHSDDQAVGRLGAEHLLAFKMASYGFVGLTEGNWTTVRAKAFESVIQAAGRTCDLFSPLGREARPRDLVALRRWLLGRVKPCAIMASNDVCGRLVLETCRDAGLLVPDDVSVLGVDNEDPLSRLVWPGLSSVSLDTTQIGYKAAASLHRMLLGLPNVIGPVRVAPFGVVARRSTRQMPVRDSALSKALTYIRNSVSAPFSVEDVRRASGVSRITLERRFRRHLDRTPLEEIQRTRLAQAKQLLVATELPLKTIAAHSGFSSAPRLIEAFLREAGLSPTAYRQHIRRQRDGAETVRLHARS